jgi:hypothetical protein
VILSRAHGETQNETSCQKKLHKNSQPSDSKPGSVAGRKIDSDLHPDFRRMFRRPGEFWERFRFLAEHDSAVDGEIDKAGIGNQNSLKPARVSILGRLEWFGVDLEFLGETLLRLISTSIDTLYLHRRCKYLY